MRCRSSARCRRRSTSGSSSASRSPGSRRARTLGNPFAGDGAFLVDARGVFMKEKKLLPEYLGLPVIVGCVERNARGRQRRRVVRSEGRARAAAPEHAQLHADAFSGARDRCLERLLPRRDGQEPHAGDVRLRQSRSATAAARAVPRLLATTANRELETVNLLVQRNIPVTFAKTAAEIINETIDPEGEEPKILKAMPVSPSAKTPRPQPATAKSKSTAADVEGAQSDAGAKAEGRTKRDGK